jgi:hypothetical protein
MNGKKLIDAIEKHHLEDFNIVYADTTPGSGTILEFENGGIELPYPEYKDTRFDGPAHIYKYKVLKIDDEGNSECYDREVDTSK